MEIMQMQCWYPVARYANTVIEHSTWKRDCVLMNQIDYQ